MRPPSPPTFRFCEIPDRAAAWGPGQTTKWMVPREREERQAGRLGISLGDGGNTQYVNKQDIVWRGLERKKEERFALAPSSVVVPGVKLFNVGGIFCGTAASGASSTGCSRPEAV